MEKLTYTTPERAERAEQAFNASEDRKKRFSKKFFANKTIIVALFLLIVVVIVMTTDIKLAGEINVAELTLSFVLLMYCSYSMYVNCSNGGSSAALGSKIYIDSKKRHEELKQKVIENGCQSKLYDFCNDYVEREQRGLRQSALFNAGIRYEDYEREYLGKDDEYIDNLERVSKNQKRAIKHANSIHPITLTPDMIFKSELFRRSRNPIGTNPHTIKTVNYSVKFAQTLLTSAFPLMIALDLMGHISWATVVSIILKVFFVILNAFFGWDFGYKNIAVHSVNYMNDQSDMMCELLNWCGIPLSEKKDSC